MSYCISARTTIAYCCDNPHNRQRFPYRSGCTLRLTGSTGIIERSNIGRRERITVDSYTKTSTLATINSGLSACNYAEAVAVFYFLNPPSSLPYAPRPTRRCRERRNFRPQAAPHVILPRSVERVDGFQRCNSRGGLGIGGDRVATTVEEPRARREVLQRRPVVHRLEVAHGSPGYGEVKTFFSFLR